MSRTKERLEIFKVTFSSLYQDFDNYDDFMKFVHNELTTVSENQIAILSEIFHNKLTLIQQVAAVLKDNWTWERLCKVEQAVLLIALAEAKIWQTDKAVIINESLITIKKYGIIENYKYINALLEKLLS